MNALNTELPLVKAEIRASIVGAFPSIAMNQIVFGDSAKRPEFERRNKHREQKNLVFAKVGLLSDVWIYIEMNESFYYDTFLYYKEDSIFAEFCYESLDEVLTLLKRKICLLKSSLEAIKV